MDFDNESLLRCFVSEEEVEEIKKWNEENDHKRSDIFEYRLEEADKLRAEGNECLKSSEFDKAQQRYRAAIWHLDFDIGQQWNLMDHHSHELNTRKLKVVTNICVAYTKEKEYVKVKHAADVGLRHMEKSELKGKDEYKEAEGKFLYLKGQANLERGFSEDAFEMLKRAEALVPGDKQVRLSLKQASQMQRKDKEAAKEVWRSKLLNEEEKKAQGDWKDPSVLMAKVRLQLREYSRRKWFWCCRRSKAD